MLHRVQINGVLNLAGWRNAAQQLAAVLGALWDLKCGRTLGCRQISKKHMLRQRRPARADTWTLRLATRRVTLACLSPQRPKLGVNGWLWMEVFTMHFTSIYHALSDSMGVLNQTVAVICELHIACEQNLPDQVLPQAYPQLPFSLGRNDIKCRHRLS